MNVGTEINYILQNKNKKRSHHARQTNGLLVLIISQSLLKIRVSLLSHCFVASSHGSK